MRTAAAWRGQAQALPARRPNTIFTLAMTGLIPAAQDKGSCSIGMTARCRASGFPGESANFRSACPLSPKATTGYRALLIRKDFNIYGNIQPFSQLKNKWIRGLSFE